MRLSVSVVRSCFSYHVKFFFLVLQLCSDVNKTATSSSHQDSEYDTASDSQSSDEAAPLPKHEPVFPSGKLQFKKSTPSE